MNYLKQKAHYENLWKKVGNWENESPNYKTRNPDQMILDFIKYLRIKKGKSLDIGCGGGRHVIAFAKAGFDSYGIDYSKTAIKLAKLDAKKKKVKINLKQGDILHLKYPKDYFDVIHDSGCLHHIKKSDWCVYLKNLIKILKPNGYFFLFCINLNTTQLTGKYPTKRKNWIKWKNHYTHFFTKKEIRSLFEKNFKIIKIYEIKKKQGLRSFYVIYMKMKKKENHEDLIRSLPEDKMELSAETKKNIKQAEKEFKQGKFHTLKQIKKEFGL